MLPKRSKPILLLLSFAIVPPQSDVWFFWHLRLTAITVNQNKNVASHANGLANHLLKRADLRRLALYFDAHGTFPTQTLSLDCTVKEIGKCILKHDL